MYNKAILMGRICNDLELKATSSGVKVLSFRLAVDRSYCAKGEERKTDFFYIVAWRSTAEFIAKYFSKGRMILVDGEFQTRTYEDKNGVIQNVTELVVSNAYFTGEPKNCGKNNSLPPLPDSAPPIGAIGENMDEDFVETAADDNYPFLK